MKKNYFRNQFTAIRFVLITFTVLLFNTAVNAQVYKEFKQRTSQYSTSKKIYNIKGDFTMIGNTNLSLLSYGKNTNNSNNLMQFVDEDNESSTKNSSAAVLEFSNENGANPECSNIIYAGLYWSGRTNNSGKTNAKRNIKVKGPNNSAYQTISANVNDILFPGPSDMYAAYAEVTDLVKNNGTGEYWVADMELSEGNGGTTGFYGGWGMIVIYENSQMDWRDVTVFDGYAHVEGNVVANYELPVSGFNTAQSGPVNMKMGIMAGEGDVGISGDYFQIKKNSNNTWLSLSHEQNTTNNFFNSSIQNNGSSRTPNYTNNTGIDISMFNIPNAGNSVIDNNQTSTTFRYGSTQDTYSIFSIAMSVDAYIPEIEGISSLSAINGNIAGNPPYNAVPGDELSYKVELKNKGTENVEDVKVVIPVPYNADYLPNGLSTNFYFSPSPQNNEVYFDPTLGATGSIVWEIDELPLANNTNDVLADLTIKFGVTKNCTILSNICPGFDLIRFNGNISGRGAITGTTFQNKDLIQGYETEGTCQGEPITTPFEVAIDATNFRAENCQNSDEARKFVYCNREDPIGISEINSGFPNGTRFFNESPVTNNSTEYTTNNPIPNNSGEYYAVIPGTENCAIPFTIEITTIASVPETEAITYCLNDEADPLTAVPSNPDFNLYYYTSEEDTSPEVQIIPSTSQSGEFIYYVAEGECASCISPNRATIKISVIGEPEITAPQNQTIQTCDNDFIDDSIPGLANEFTTISQQVFTDLGGSISFTEEIESISYKDFLQQQSPAVYQRIFRITYECGNIDVQQSLTLENIKTQLEPVYTKKDPTCENENGVLTITNFNTDYIYELNSATGNFELNNATSSLSPGVYTISVALNECVFTTNSFEVLSAPAIAETPETIVVTQPTCNIETGKITVNATEGYMYSLDGEIFQASNIFEKLSPGTYVIYAQNEDECISQPSKNIIIEENEGSPAQPEAIVSQQPTCEDTTGIISVTTDDGITYTLLDENDNAVNNTIENGKFNDLAAGSYFVQASNGDCEAISEAIVIEENEGSPEQPEAIISQQPTCEDTTGTISVTTVDGITYTLLDSNQSALNDTIENGEFSDLSAGTYYVKASNGDCETVSQAIVLKKNEGSPDQPEAIASQQPTCEDTTGTIAVTTVQGISYILLDENQNALNNTIENGEFTDLTAGTYFVQASNDDCESVSEALVIEENEGSPAQPEATVSPQPTCEDTTGTISVTTIEGISYTLLDENQNALNNAIENGEFSDLAAGTYFIQASNGDCETISEELVIEKNQGSLAQPEVIVSQQPTCEDTTGTISVTTVQGITYSLLDENQNAVNNTIENGEFSNLTAGTYFIQASNGDCEATSKAIIIKENQGNPVQPEASISQQPTCEDITGAISVTTDDGITYILLNENQNSLSNSIENGEFSDLTEGTYFVKASNGDCEAISEALVIEENKGNPAQPEAIVSQQPTCEDTTGTISVTTDDGITYTLLDENENPLNNTIENGEFSNLAAGTYFVQAGNEDCEAISEALVIEENQGSPAQPEAIVSQQPTCENITGVISVATVQGITYTLLDENQNSLSNSIENGGFLDLTDGTYFVQASNGDCEATSEAVVIEENQGSPVQPEAIVSQQPTCEDITGAILVTTVQGITYTLLDENQNSLSNSIENGEFTNLSAGTYLIQASNEDCEATSKAIVIEENKGNPAHPEAIVSQQPTCEDTTGTISVTTVDVISYTLLDSNQNPLNNTIENGEFSNLTAGTYFVQASNGDCKTTSEAIVIGENQGSPAQPEATVSQQPTCEDTTGTISVTSVQGITYTLLDENENVLNDTIENDEFLDLPAGTYFVQASNGDCEAISEAIIIQENEGSPMQPEAFVSQKPTCADTTGTISVTTVQGITYTLLDSNENTLNNTIENGNFNDLAAGTYFIQASNGDCEAISEAIVIEENQGSPAQPEAIVSQQPTCEDTTATISVTTNESITYTLLDENENVLNNAIENGDFSDLLAGTYFVQASNGDCEATSEAILIEDNEGSPVQPEAIVSQQPTCEDVTGTISVTIEAGINYTLLDENQNAVNNTIENGEFSDLAAGTYFVQASNGDCEAISEAIVIEENEGNPAQPEATVSQPTCEDTTGAISVTIVQGISYTLLDENQNALSNAIENGEFSDLAAGSYFVKANNEDCGTVSEAIVIEKNAGSPESPVITSVTNTTCGESNGIIEFELSEGLSYILKDSEENEYSHENGIISNLASGTYYLVVQNNDCESTIEIIVEADLDEEAPVIISCPTDLTNVATDEGMCSASNFVLGDLVAEDNCDSELSITHDAPEVFEPGETIVTWTVKDKSGNTTTCTQTIIVIDNQAPVIAEVETINTTTDADTCGAMISINAPEATDNCSVGNVIGTRDDNQDLEAEYPVGTTTITWTATDENGNEAELVIQTVNVEDNEAPVIAEVETINITTDVDNCGAMITINAPEATDNCSVGNVIGTRDDNQDLDAEYPMGTTTITWTATDVNGNEAVPVIQIVNVEDNQAPIIAEVETINTTTDTDTCGAMITINAPEATDNCSVGNVIGTRDDNQDLEAEYPVGTTTITWTATDENGNEAEPVIQIVTVIDDQAPSIECPDNMIFSTETNVDFATVNFDNPLAIDNCEVIVEQTGGPIFGSQFPIGTTTVTFTATDSSGNTSKCSFDITIEDTEDPSLECPLDISKDIDAGLCAAVVEFETPEGFDNSGDVTVEQTAGLSSGEVFPVGTTTITFTASDSAGNTTSCSFNVTVIDDEAPVIEEKNDITVNTDPDLCGAIVEYDIPSGSDDCGIESIALTKGLAPGSEFPIGQTTVTYTATDINGNSANSSFTVTVIDNESPTISCPEDITLNVEFGTGNVVVNYEAIIGSDNCSETSIELVEGYASGEEFPVGQTTVTYKVTDAAGNSASCSFTVIVEEDLEETPPAPDAPQVEVIQPDCVTPTGVILINIEDGLTYSIDEENYYAVDEFTALEPGTYSVTARDEFDQVSEATVVTLEDPVASEIQTSTISLCTEDITFDLFELLQGDYDTSGTWVDPENTGVLNQGTIDPALLQVGTYTFNYQLNNGTCNSTTEVTVSINDDCVVLPCSLEDIQSSISKAVTPNNDNHNDYFSIDFASECGFTYDVKIFNRWGSKVYEAVNYQNDWDGYSTNSITSSNQLPSGTYFYILEIRNSGFAPIQGYIYLGTK